MKKPPFRFSSEDFPPDSLGQIIKVLDWTSPSSGPPPGHNNPNNYRIVDCPPEHLCNFGINAVIGGARVLPLVDENPALQGINVLVADLIITDSQGKLSLSPRL